jgi:lipopolysaccharide/colanic/teichoic acid biosynthesis glycosyltransferase
MQRILDLIFSSLTIIFFSPVLIIIVILLKITGEGEVFYRQIRVGKNGIPFKLLKFATMLKDSPNIGSGEITISNDPRVLPIGKFLRKSKINELPQLLNIFLGHMSIVGPRPMVPNTYSHYSKKAQKILNSVKPGLTGVGSIIFRNEENILNGLKDPNSFYIKNITPYKSELEIWYVMNKSLFLYFKIIIITAYVIIFPNYKLSNKLFEGIPEVPENLLIKNLD